MIEKTSIQFLIDEYLKLFISSRNGIFVGFFYMAIANFLTTIKKKENLKLCITEVVMMIGLLFETWFIRNRHYTEDHSLFLFLPIIASLLFLIAKNVPIYFKGKTIRNLSIGIYLLHRPILGYFDYFFHIQSKLNSIQLFLLVSTLSLIVSYLLQKLNNKYINKIIT